MQSCTTVSSPSRLFIVSCISLCLLVSIDSIASANNLVKSICDKSKTPGECEMALGQDPRSEAAATPRELADICLDLADANATKCVEGVMHLQTLNTTPPAWMPALETCAQQLNYSAMEFRTGKLELKEDPLSASYDVFVATDGAQMCDDAMKKDNVTLPQVTAYGDNIRFFALIAENIVDLMIKP